MDVDLYQVFGWVFLAMVLMAIPIATAVHSERRHRRDVLRQRAKTRRIHEWQERCIQLDRQDARRIAQRESPEAFRPSRGRDGEG